jgi:hypothetical protein
MSGTRVWISPDGEAIRYQFETEDHHEVSAYNEGETWVDGVPAGWTELTAGQ